MTLTDLLRRARFVEKRRRPLLRARIRQPEPRSDHFDQLRAAGWL